MYLTGVCVHAYMYELCMFTYVSMYIVYIYVQCMYVYECLPAYVYVYLPCLMFVYFYAFIKRYCIMIKHLSMALSSCE